MIIRWIVLTLAVWVAANLVPGISYDRWPSLLIAALVLGILNAFVKPLLMLFSLPVILVTLGLFVVLINAGLLMLTAWLVPGFHVADLWAALVGSLVVSLISIVFGIDRRGRRNRYIVVERHGAARRFQQPRPPPGKGPIIDV